MKSYIKPKIIVYSVNIESLLAAESNGQGSEWGAKNNNGAIWLEDDSSSSTCYNSLWDDDDDTER